MKSWLLAALAALSCVVLLFIVLGTNAVPFVIIGAILLGLWLGLTRLPRKQAWMPLMILGLVITFIAGPAAAQTAAVTGVDLSPVLTFGLQGVGMVILLAAAWFIYGHVKDANARTALMSILEKGVSLGYNVVDGALKDKVVNVNVGSSVASQALKYALQYGPDAIAHFGLTPASLAKMIWARLPAVDGPVSEDTFNQIVATATGTPAPSVSIGAQVEQLAPAVLQWIGDYYLTKKAAAAAPPAAPPA